MLELLLFLFISFCDAERTDYLVINSGTTHTLPNSNPWYQYGTLLNILGEYDNVASDTYFELECDNGNSDRTTYKSCKSDKQSYMFSADQTFSYGHYHLRIRSCDEGCVDNICVAASDTQNYDVFSISGNYKYIICFAEECEQRCYYDCADNYNNAIDESWCQSVATPSSEYVFEYDIEDCILETPMKKQYITQILIIVGALGATALLSVITFIVYKKKINFSKSKFGTLFNRKDSTSRLSQPAKSGYGGGFTIFVQNMMKFPGSGTASPWASSKKKVTDASSTMATSVCGTETAIYMNEWGAIPKRAHCPKCIEMKEISMNDQCSVCDQKLESLPSHLEIKTSSKGKNYYYDSKTGKSYNSWIKAQNPNKRTLTPDHSKNRPQSSSSPAKASRVIFNRKSRKNNDHLKPRKSSPVRTSLPRTNSQPRTSKPRISIGSNENLKQKKTNNKQ